MHTRVTPHFRAYMDKNVIYKLPNANSNKFQWMSSSSMKGRKKMNNKQTLTQRNRKLVPQVEYN